MKHFKHPVIYTILSIVLFISASAFTFMAVDFNPNKARYAFFKNYFTDYIPTYYTAEDIKTYFPDTTKVITFSDNDSNEKYFVRKWFGIPPSYIIVEYFIERKDENDYYYIQSEEFEKRFTETYGVPLEGKSIKMATGETFYFFNPKAVKAVFDKLYAKPSTKFENITYQTLYNIALKKYFRDVVKLMSYLHTTEKQEWTQVTTRFLTRAKISKEFNIYEESDYARNKLFPTEKSRKQFPNFSEEIYSGYLGPILRRHCDGTLPVMLNCLKTILKDYDPEALKLVKGF
ncbi:MAG: hypothetical protein KF781_09535 [Chitinophagaceae bacterium]|nr:hypothetical protein [Chitinophagaceae bacterium]MCW5905485.1 hypothetical protein [Chitinophagaceae bacterium]